MTGVDTQAGSTTVSWARAVRIEFGLVGRARRRFLLGVLGVLLVGAVFMWAQAVRGGWNEPPRDLGGAFMATLLFTLLWSGEAWRDAPADARDWFWAQPIGQGQHELARVVAGLGWLALAALLLIALQLLVTVAYGQSLLLDHQSALKWVNLLTGPVIVYLLGSIAGMRSAHPLAWIIGVTFAVMALPDILGAGRSSAIGHASSWVIWTLIGPFNEAQPHVVPAGAPWSGLWLSCALGTIAAAVLAVVLVARVRRPS